MAEILWTYLISVIIILFTIIIGLKHKPSHKHLISYTLILSIIILIFNQFNTQLYPTIIQILPWILGITGILLIYTAIQTIKQEQALLTKILPSILFIINITLLFILTMNKTTNNPLIYTGIIFIVIIILVTIFKQLGKILEKSQTPYTNILGNYTILAGILILLIGAFIPGLETIKTLDMQPLTIESSSLLIILIMGLLGIFLIGVFLEKNKKIKN